jgi:hypothetical protein
MYHVGIHQSAHDLDQEELVVLLDENGNWLGTRGLHGGSQLKRIAVEADS